jgi:hypothetical protein
LIIASVISICYAKTDAESGRKYLEFANGDRSYFPDRLSRQMKSGISDDGLCTLVVTLFENDELCKVSDINNELDLTQIICSMSLVGGAQ